VLGSPGNIPGREGLQEQVAVPEHRRMCLEGAAVEDHQRGTGLEVGVLEEVDLRSRSQGKVLDLVDRVACHRLEGHH
jgi:hypothetical protein